MAAWIALLLLIVTGVVLIASHDAGTVLGMQIGDFAMLATMAALLIFIGGALIGDYRGRLTNAVKDFVTWAALALALMVGYTYRAELQFAAHRVLGDIMPPGSIALSKDQDGGRAVRLRRQPNGHFVARTTVNKNTITMLVDTGASSVVLTPSDARAAGIDVERLRYSVPVQTANGTTFAAPILLDQVNVGPIGFSRIQALVSKPGAMRQSLLGMSFLSKLRSYTFSGDYMTLRR
ncbi:MAG: TIGR02281 family clan AA aspartic protease [Pseudomonadota bacterium]